MVTSDHADTATRRPPMRRSGFVEDERAIEGLPVRLVIALVVGVASLSVMMGMIDGIGSLGMTELDVTLEENDVIYTGEATDLTATVVDPEGTPVNGATVILRGESAQLSEGIETEHTTEDGTVSFTVDPELSANQRQGTLAIDIKPPAGAEYVDKRSNTEVLVLRK